MQKMRINLNIYVIMSACLVLLLVLQVSAQEFKYKVQQDRLIGHRDGELIISNDRVEFRAKKKTTAGVGLMPKLSSLRSSLLLACESGRTRTES